MADVKLRPFYRKVNGIWINGMFKDENLLEVMNYKPTSDDVFIVTYPKCGTTWMQNIAMYIFRKGKELEDYNDFSRICPFIDPKGIQGILEMPRPGAFKTHLPYNLMPYSPDANYIYVLRNPKDCCVSLYYHAISCKAFKFSEGTFDCFFEMFMAGEVEYNDYFDHLMSFYPHRNNKQVFYTTYEDMKADTKTVIVQLATFLGREYIEAIEKDNNVLNNILQFSGFEYMMEHLADEFDSVRSKNIEINETDEIVTDAHSKPLGKRCHVGVSHFRKGVVGDWRSYFSEEQSERMNRKFQERFQGTEIYEKYKPLM